MTLSTGLESAVVTWKNRVNLAKGGMISSAEEGGGLKGKRKQGQVGQ